MAAATALVVAASGAALLTTVSPAAADPNITLNAATSPMWQTDAAVWAIATDAPRNRVYAGGEFTTVRPPGVPIGGAGQVTRNRLAAFDRTTGNLVTAVNVNVSGRVLALALSPDGTTLYLGGDFSYVNGQRRNKAAAIDLTSAAGTLLSWNPNFSGGGVRAISATDTAVYFGGDFTSAAGTGRTRAAAFAPRGALLPWAPNLNGPVNALLAQPAQNRVFVGGDIDYFNGVRIRSLASLRADTGANNPTLANGLIPSGNPGSSQKSVVKSIVADGTTLYVGAEGSGGGWFDGTLAVDPGTGALKWRSNCLGASQGVAVLGGALYIGSHAHDCTAIDGFGQMPNNGGPLSWRTLTAQRTTDGSTLTWFPNTNAGPTNNADRLEVGPRVLVTDGTSLFVGGHFTTVNGVAQQGLTRFQPGPDTTKPTIPLRLRATNPTPGTVVLHWTGSEDANDPALTYRVYRDGVRIGQTGPVSGRWYNAAQLVYRDSTAGPATRRYSVEAVDGTGNVGARSGAVTITAATGSTGSYSAAVLADAPSQFWRLDETTGSTANAVDNNGRTGTYRGNVALGQPGPFGDTSRSVALNDGFIASNGSSSVPSNTQSMELWFRTETKSGGRILGWGNSQTGTSGSYDRHVYMNKAGQLLFGSYNGSTQVAWGAKSYNDGTWHHLVATMGPAGLRLYVDGAQAAALTSTTTGQNYGGWFRVGNDNLNGWPRVTLSTALGNYTATPAFEGQVAHLALYPRQLSADRVAAHYAAGE